MYKLSMLLTFLLFTLGSFTPAPPTVAPAMPSIQVVDMNGKEVDLKALCVKGRTTVFSFWATWCVPCKQELKSYNNSYKRWAKDYNVDFYAVSVDENKTPENLKSFAKAMGWGFNILHDNKQIASQTFRITSIPLLIVVNKEGYIVHKQAGYSPATEEELEAKLKALK